ncbi:MAG: hypothetical protein LBQ92_01275 [Propionibacteriaceae bacterium]|jgi:hypothetical protein|nr:hypothetical protein [Propionibacteriaceae bacterium]
MKSMIAAATILAAAMLGGCSADSGRSVDAYCGVLEDSTHSMKETIGQWQQFSGGDFSDTEKLMSSLEASLQNISELRATFDRLEEVAPDDIHSDITTIKNLMDTAAENSDDLLDNPLGAAATMGTQFMLAIPAMQRFESYTRENCDISLV